MYVCIIVVLVAVTVIVYDPSGVERDVDTVRVDLEYGPTVEGSDVIGPCRRSGETDAERLTVSLNPSVPCIETVNVVEPPLLTELEDGLTVRVKSGGWDTLNDTTTEWDNLLLVP